MFGRRRITKKDYPGLLSQMAKDLENSKVMVGRMEDWATKAELDDVAEGLYQAYMAIKDAQDDADRAARRVADELEKEAQER